MLNKIKKVVGNFLRNMPVTVNIDGNKLLVQKWVSKSFIDYDEFYTIELFKTILKEGSVFFDIGANIGFYTILASKVVGNKGIVYAFEPDPRNIKLLKRNIVNNHIKNVRTSISLIGNETKTTNFNLDIDPTESSMFVLEKRKEVQYKKIIVPMTTLDNFVKENKVEKIDFIKIDVEGAEPLVIRGMKNIIMSQDNLHMVIEFHPKFLYDGGTSPIYFLEMLEELGFKLFGINEEKKILFNEVKKYLTSDYKIANFDKINLLAVKGEINSNIAII